MFIERLFKNHFWLFVLPFLLSSSYLLASLASSWASHVFSSPKAFGLHRKVKTSSDIYLRKNSSYAVMNKANLFDSKNELLTPPTVFKSLKKKEKEEQKKKEAQKGSGTCDPNGTYQRSKLPLQLRATVIADRPDESMAAIWDNRGRKTLVVKPSEIVFGIQICAISRKILKLDRGGGQLEYLELGAKPGRGGNYNTRRSIINQYRRLRKTKIDTSNIRKGKGNNYSLSRTFLTKMTNNLHVLASQAAIIPYFHKGQPAGFRIRNIRKNSLYTKLGLKNNDVIRRINGYEFTSPQKALEAFHNLMHAKNLSVDLLRRKKAQSYNYNVRDE